MTGSIGIEHLSQILSIVSDPVCILDSSLIIRGVNDLFLSLFQISRDSVLFQPVQIAFTGQEVLDRIIPVLYDRALQSGETSEFEYDLSPERDLSGWYQIIIGPVKEDNDMKGVSGYYILARKINARRSLLSDHSPLTVLVQITHEICTDNRNFINPRRLIQQVLSRLGPVFQAEYLSYFEFYEQGGKMISFSEISIWSSRYGFIMGEDWAGGTLEENAQFLNFFSSLLEGIPIIFNLSTAPDILGSMLLHREVTQILIFPVKFGNQVKGCFILWDTIMSWSASDLNVLAMMADIIGAGLARIQIESDLVRSEEKFNGVIEYIGDMYYLTDKTGCLLEISPSMATILGYQDASELLGRNMESLFIDPIVWPLFLSEVIRDNGVKDYELILEGNNGKVITGSVSCRLIYDEEGELRGIEGVIRDISRRRQYEQMIQESEWKLVQAQKIAKLGVWSYDIVTKKFRISPEVFSMLVIPGNTNVLTLDYLILASSVQDRPKFSPYFEHMVQEGNEFEFEFRLDLPDEKFKFFRIKGQPKIKDGIVSGSFGIIQDITERKEVEQHLLRYANQLEQKTIELDAMRIQLLDMNRELDQRVRMRTYQIEDLLRQKDDFIVQIGHDLKTPLTPLVALLPYVRKKTTDPELRELLDISINDVGTIKKMVTTVLELAQMNALYTISDLKQIHLHSAVNQIISDNAYLIHQKSLTISNEIPDSCDVMLSQMHLETLMGNIISNAVKYSYINGMITITAEEENDSVTVTIRDYGVGIEPYVIPRIFDEFFRADHSRHDRESHGLGLSIVRRVVDLYGGAISVTSEGLGKGSAFSVKLIKTPKIKSNTEKKGMGKDD